MNVLAELASGDYREDGTRPLQRKEAADQRQVEDAFMKPATEFSNPADVHPPLGPYTHVAAVPADTELFFISGQLGLRPDGSVGASLEEQADQAFANLIAVLRGCGLGAINIVKLTTFVVAGQNAGETRDARMKYLGSHRPASTLVYISQLAQPEWLVEVEAVAAKVKT